LKLDISAAQASLIAAQTVKGAADFTSQKELAS